jgi:hypothetical protein
VKVVSSSFPPLKYFFGKGIDCRKAPSNMDRHVLHSLGEAGRDAIFVTIIKGGHRLVEISMLKCDVLMQATS